MYVLGGWNLNLEWAQLVRVDSFGVDLRERERFFEVLKVGC